jgi:hypothetical protein
MGNPGPMLSKNFLATPPHSTLIYGLSCCARYAGTNAPRVPCTDNGRILLANLLQSSRSTFSRGSLLNFFAFKEGMLSTPISVLGVGQQYPVVFDSTSGGKIATLPLMTRSFSLGQHWAV